VNIGVAGVWYFAPRTTAAIASTLILAATFWILTKLNRVYTPEKRVYPFGD
jgi:hypothetical protein